MASCIQRITLMASKKEKTKRTDLSIDDRIKILERFEKGEKRAKLAHEYNINKSTISNIKKRKENLLKQRSSLIMHQANTSRKRYTGIENSRLDQFLYEWFLQEKNNGIYVSGPMIQKKALEINKTLNGPDSFKASAGFLQKFQKRHSITLSRAKKETTVLEDLDQDSSDDLQTSQELIDVEQGWQILNDRVVAPKCQTNDDPHANFEEVKSNEHSDDSDGMDDITAKNAY